jgi:C4-dicarboxylate-specific signal transduction histidine kinase
MIHVLRSHFQTFIDKCRASISVQLLSVVLIISSSVSFVIATAQLAFDYTQEINELNKELGLIQRGYSDEISQSIWDMNDSQVRAGLQGIHNFTDIQYVEVVADGKIIYQTGTLPLSKSLRKTFPLIHKKDGKPVHLGDMTVVASTAQVFNRLKTKMFFIFMSQLLKTWIVSTFVLIIIRHILVRHLVAITSYLKTLDFSSLNKDFRLDRKNSVPDELDILVEAINRMKANLYHAHQESNEFNQRLERKVVERTHLLEESQRVITEQQKVLVASAKMSALGEMAGGIAHEINNPLAALQSISYQVNELLTEDPIEKDEVVKMTSMMIKLTERISKIVQGLRSFSRDGSIDLAHRVDVQHLVDDTLSFCGERFKAHGIQLIVESVPQGMQFEGRETEISQVLLNLLNNAHDAIAEMKEKWVRISFEDLGESIEIHVTDSGTGIPPEIQKKLFQPFFTTKEIGKGTGLGLSISFGIVRRHGGQLILDESNPHTRFVLRLPKKQDLQGDLGKRITNRV